MNTRQIERCLNVGLEGTSTKAGFLGALPKDYAAKYLMSPPDRSPLCFVANTQTSDMSGEHWVAYYYNCGVLEFFDSYGLSPYQLSMPTGVWSKNHDVVWNSKSLQGLDSDVCGQYAIYFLVKRSRNETMRDIVHPFSFVDSRSNDVLVRNFVCRRFKYCIPVSLGNKNLFSSSDNCVQASVTRCKCKK